MENAIKEYKELTAVRLKDDRIITTELSVEQLTLMLNKSDFIMLGDEGINKYEVKSYAKFVPNDIEQYIYSQPKDIGEKMKRIYEDRKKEGLRIGGVEHIIDIYKNKYEK